MSVQAYCWEDAHDSCTYCFGVKSSNGEYSIWFSMPCDGIGAMFGDADCWFDDFITKEPKPIEIELK